MKLFKLFIFIISITLFTLYGCKNETKKDFVVANGVVVDVTSDTIQVISETHNINGKVKIFINNDTSFDQEVNTEFKMYNIVKIHVIDFDYNTMEGKAYIVKEILC